VRAPGTAGWEPLQATESGGIWSPLLRAELRPLPMGETWRRPAGIWLRVLDPRTAQPLPTAEEEAERAQHEEQARRQAEARAALAEERAKHEEQVRRQAEERARAEEEARRRAEAAMTRLREELERLRRQPS
jgi:hypothetical protein